jgi:hypothetical protein
LPKSPLYLSNSSAVYQLGGKDLSIDSLRGESGSTVELGSNKLTINHTNSNLRHPFFKGNINGSGQVILNEGIALGDGATISAIIAGVGGINVSGAKLFKVTLSGNNTYEGPTVVSSTGELIGSVSPSSTLQLEALDAGYVLGGANQTIGALEGFGIVN